MTSPVVIAIDSGGTTVKIAAFDLQGRAIASDVAEVTTTHHADGRVERDADAVWTATARTVRAVVEACDGRDVLSVGVTGFGNGVFLIDANGAPTRPAIVSVDHRAQPLVDRLAASGDAEKVGEVTGTRLWGGQTVMQIAGLGLAEPDVMARTRWALSCKDFIRFRLTGEALTDPTDSSGGGLIDVRTGAYSTLALSMLGVPELVDRLPPVSAPGQVAGRVDARASAQTRLRVGTPVAGSMMDVAACVLGAGSARQPVMTMIAGTWSINCIESSGPKAGAAPILNMDFGEGRRLIAEGSPCSAANLGWCLENVLNGAVSYEQADALAGAIEVQRRRCHFLPYVFGPDPRTGGFLDIRASDDLGTMLRGLMEGVAFQHLRHANDAVAQTPERFPETIRLAGGAARSPAWGQIFADICQREVECARVEEVGALGVAICAAVAAGGYGSLAEATTAMTGVRARFEPDRTHAAFYEDRFAAFQELDAALLERPAFTSRG
jgi:L-xylulokinase